MTTDRKNFQSHDFRAIIMTTKYPGVVQLVARDIWEQDAAGSNPVTRTKKPLKSDDFRGFFFVYCGAGFDAELVVVRKIPAMLTMDTIAFA